MAREKVDFRENLALLIEKFGDVQLIPLQSAADTIGIDIRTMQRANDCPVKKIGRRYYITLVGLARWIS